jgi:ATP-dependent Clp protease ATP-binding subunit ClpC
MFERFTDRARRVVVLAQDEARGLQHNYIGTEHILLGLLGGGGVAGRILDRFDMPIDEVREDIKARVGLGKTPPRGRIPFTPRAKKVLELALREALKLSHNYIGTEHILLGVIREGDGVAAQVLSARAGDLLKVRMAVLDAVPSGEPARGQRWLRRRMAAFAGGESGEPAEAVEMRVLPGEADEMPTTPAAEASLAEALRLAGGQAVGSHHLLLAALADRNTAVARTLAGLGVDLDQARDALRQADVTGTSDEQPAEAGRRQMRIRVSDDQLTIEATDQAIVALGRAALESLGDQSGPAGVIAGDLPVSGSFSDLWQALKESLEDVIRRTVLGADDEPGPDTAEENEEPSGEDAADPSAEPKTGTDNA